MEIVNNPDRRPTTDSFVVPDLDTVKSLYYWINAKPDTTIKTFEEKKKITIADIRTLKDALDKKLDNHIVVNYIPTMNFILSDGNIKDYGSWAEFERENWDTINLKTKAINLVLDMTITLPKKYALPQRHTMKLRIGDAIPPKDMFQIVFSSDDPSELIEVRANAICKIDFINQTLANELMHLVSEWYDGLPKVEETNHIQIFLEKNQSNIITSIGGFTPVLVLFIYHLYISIIWSRMGWNNNFTLIGLQSIFVSGMFVFSIGILLGRIFAKWIDKKIDKLKHFTGFLITRGDKNYNEEIIKENKKIQNSMFFKAGIAAFSAIISVVIKFILENFFMR